MSKQLHQAMQDIIVMPYFKNDSSRSGKVSKGHEDAIALRLTDAGFSEVNTHHQNKTSNIPKLLKEVMNEWIDTDLDPNFLLEKTDHEYKRVKDAHKTRRFKNMPVGSFIAQPCGSNSFPDFLIRDFDGRFVPLEAKSGKKQEGKDQKDNATTGAPMWNDNLPKHGAIYVYSNEKNNKTTVAMGEDVIDKEVIEIRKEMDRENELLVEKYKVLFRAADKKRRGWDPDYRPQNFQSGGMEFTDWFNHEDRTKCEQNVLAFALAQ
jgi:hypothetical protein